MYKNTVILNPSEGEESKLAVKLCYYDIITFRFFGLLDFLLMTHLEQTT